MAIGAPDAKIIFTKAPFLKYEQFLLDKDFRQYLETIMFFKKIFKMDVQKHLSKKYMKCLLVLIPLMLIF